MKKLLCLLLVLTMIAAFAGCGETDGTPGETTAAADTSEAPATDTAADTEEETDDESDLDPDAVIGKLTVAGRLISEYKVVLPETPDPAEKHAADELIAYIEKASNVKLTVSDGGESGCEILIGNTSRANAHVDEVKKTLGDEGYMLYVDGNKLYITGNAPRGTMYGVYSFLEDYIGCRFYTPECERIIPAKRVDIPADLDFSFVPPVEYRNVYSLNAVQPEFSAKNKINGFPRHDLTEELGGIPIIYGMTQNFVHTLGYLNNSDPEVTPCLTDENVYATVLENVRNYLGGHPEVNIISVSQCDNLNYCKCENCMKCYAEHGNQPSATILTFVNRIADAIKDEFPDVTVDTLAYQYSMNPPTGIPVADNVMIRLCSIDCCMIHGFDECKDAHNGEFLNALKKWQKLTDNIYVWYYDANYNSLNTPLPTLKTNMKNIRLLVQNGVKGFFAEGLDSCFNSGEFPELRSYLMSKMLWDPLMTDERYFAYLDDFLDGYYGAAAPFVRRYIDAVCDRAIGWEDGSFHAFCLTLKPEDAIPGQDSREYAFSEEMLAIWNEALAAVPEGSDEWKRTDTSSIQMEYFYLKLRASKLEDKLRVKKLHDKMKAIETYKDAWTPLPKTVNYGGKLQF